MKFTGSDPNVNPSTESPETLGVVYESSENKSKWIWNGQTYVRQPHHGTPTFHITLAKDVRCDGVGPTDIRELCIYIPEGLRTLCAEYVLRVLVNSTDSSGVVFPRLEEEGNTLNNHTLITFISPSNPNPLFLASPTPQMSPETLGPLGAGAEKTIRLNISVSNDSSEERF